MLTMADLMDKPVSEEDRRKLRTEACQKKRQYHSRAKAEAHHATLPESFSECIAFECPMCGCWHLGRLRKQR
jgi:hypothetical protein